MIACASAWLAGTARGNGSRAVLVITESAEPLYLFVFAAFPDAKPLHAFAGNALG
jgi:hypothetical protein